MSKTRLVLGAVAALMVLAPLGYLWQASRMPASYSVMDMGYVDTGGGPAAAHGAPAAHDAHGSRRSQESDGVVSVDDLVERSDRPADVSVDLVAEQTGERYTVNGSSPGPLIEATAGQLIEVRVRNASVRAGVSMHWHGIDVPNAEDGVAGVTQDAIREGDQRTYRFVADVAGTYWYHSHQVSHRQVLRGLFGPIVIHPSTRPKAVDVVAVAHTYAGRRTLNGSPDDHVVAAAPGQRARVRVINTDNGTVQVWSDAAYKVLAVDGHDLNGPTLVQDRRVGVAAGGRADLEVIAPARVQVGSTAVLVGSDDPAPEQPKRALDLLSYGAPATLPFDAARADRSFAYNVGRRPGFVAGKPGMWWSINGHLWPNVPMFLVDEGDVVVFQIKNTSGDIHPMHLHGHHAVVLARNGRKATGSPWWVDSLDVREGESYEIAFVADNPGIWMDHCHNLKHAAEGLVAHLMYAGVDTAYRLGADSGNEPE